MVTSTYCNKILLVSILSWAEVTINYLSTKLDIMHYISATIHTITGTLFLLKIIQLQ